MAAFKNAVVIDTIKNSRYIIVRTSFTNVIPRLFDRASLTIIMQKPLAKRTTPPANHYIPIMFLLRQFVFSSQAVIDSFKAFNVGLFMSVSLNSYGDS